MTGFNNTRPHSKKLAGFSLLELMIVVVIIGIVAAYGYSVYTENIIQTRRSDAKEALSRLATLQEKFFTECNQYATILTTRAVGSTCPGLNIPWSDAAPFVSSEGHYAISLIDPTGFGPNPASLCTPATCFMLQANPVGPGASGYQTRNGASDGNLRLDHAGRKSWDKGNGGLFDANNTMMYVNGAGIIINWSAK